MLISSRHPGVPLRRNGAATLALAAAFGAAGTFGIASPAAAGQPHRTTTPAGVVFVQNDNPAGNAVVAYDRGAGGRLTRSHVYATGGRGGVLDGSVVDHLASQGSLALNRARDTLYAVNAGSNTVTVFGVAGDQLSRRAVVPSGGTFPVSVATHGRLVYVLNARGGGSVQGFRNRQGQLVRIPGSHRSLGLDTSASPEFVNTPGQVAFSPDGSHLLVTTKANGNDVDAYAVTPSGSLSAAPTVNSLPGTVPFAVTWDPAGRLVLAEAGSDSVATFALTGGGVLHSIATAATGQAATCWIVGYGHRVFASNAGSANLSGYRVAGGRLTSLGTTGTDPGTVDATITRNGEFLYVQTGQDGKVDAYRVLSNGSLKALGSVIVPNGAGGEGIVAG